VFHSLTMSLQSMDRVLMFTICRSLITIGLGFLCRYLLFLYLYMFYICTTVFSHVYTFMSTVSSSLASLSYVLLFPLPSIPSVSLFYHRAARRCAVRSNVTLSILKELEFQLCRLSIVYTNYLQVGNSLCYNE
jgi:hypothetical protein